MAWCVQGKHTIPALPLLCVLLCMGSVTKQFVEVLLSALVCASKCTILATIVLSMQYQHNVKLTFSFWVVNAATHCISAAYMCKLGACTGISCSSRAIVSFSCCRYANIGGMGFQEKLVLQKKAQVAIENGEKPPNVLGMDEALQGTEMQQQR